MSGQGGQTTKQTYVTRYSTDVDPRTLPDFKQRGVYRPTSNEQLQQENNNNNWNAQLQPYSTTSPSRSSPSVSEMNSVTSDGHRLRKKYTVTTVTTVTTTTILLPNMQDAVVIPSNTTYNQISDNRDTSMNNEGSNNVRAIEAPVQGGGNNALLIQAAPSRMAQSHNNNNSSSNRQEVLPYQASQAVNNAATREKQAGPPLMHVQPTHNERNALIPTSTPGNVNTITDGGRLAGAQMTSANAPQWRFVQNNTTGTSQAVCYDKPPTLAELGIASYFVNKEDDVQSNNAKKYERDVKNNNRNELTRNEAAKGMRTSSTTNVAESSVPRQASQNASLNKSSHSEGQGKMSRLQKPVQYIPGNVYGAGSGLSESAPYVAQETRSELEGGIYSRR